METVYNNKNRSPTNQSGNKTNSPRGGKKKRLVTSDINFIYRGVKRNKRSYRDKGEGNNVDMRGVVKKKQEFIIFLDKDREREGIIICNKNPLIRTSLVL